MKQSAIQGVTITPNPCKTGELIKIEVDVDWDKFVPDDLEVLGDGETIGTRARLEQPWEAKLQAQGGYPPYTWEMTAGRMPKGLTMQTDGTMSGTPDEYGTFGYLFRVTDSEGNTARNKKQMWIRVDRIPVNFRLREQRVPYTGEPIKPDVYPKDDRVQPEDYIVLVGGKESVTNTGSYLIEVRMIKITRYNVGVIETPIFTVYKPK